MPRLVVAVLLVALLVSAQVRGQGLLLHVSFDVDRKADFAAGEALPIRGRYGYENYTAGGGVLVPGVFGQALAGGRSLGAYDALTNFNPRHGTVAFFLKQRNRPYGFEPLLVTPVDQYYWYRYLRLELKPGGSLTTSIANEIYRPRQASGQVGAIRDDVWQHIAIVWDEARGFTTYLDGEIYSSNWGRYSWLAHGVDPNAIQLRPDSDVAYDELYVFDRPLTQEQVRTLMRENRQPTLEEMPPLTFDHDRRRHRLEELSWTRDDPALPRLTLGRNRVIRQVVPLRARAVMNECNNVIDGKLGNGWPALYGYRYADGNGLHVELPDGQPIDYVMIEGRFSGRVYDQRLLIEDGREPMARIASPQFLHRWRLDQPRRSGWLSFFRYAPEKLDEAPDKEQLINGRINELGFFHIGGSDSPPVAESRWYLGPATEATTLYPFPPGDRHALAVSASPPQAQGREPIPALRYRHILLPAADHPRVLAAFRLLLHLDGELEGNALRVELRDPKLPTRRLMAFDAALDPGASRLLDITFDLADRVVPAGLPLWITLCFKRDVDVVWDERHASGVEWIGGDWEQVIDAHLAGDLPMMLARFAELSSPRPWGSSDEPETQLPRHYRLAGELFKPLAFLRQLRPEHPTIRALWAWTHKDTEDTSPVVVEGEGPRWALLQHALIRQCRAVFEWWIDNRLAPTGEFGDDLNDDTDFMQDMPRYVMFSDPEGRLGAAALAVADACVNLGAITAGVSTIATDPLHAYENGTNILPVAAMIRFGDPARLTPVMEAHRTIEERFTARDAHGRLRFRSNYLGYHEIREEGDYGRTSFTHALFAHPALYLAYYSRNPRALKFITDYADGWIAYWRDAENQGINPGQVPSSTTLDGVVRGWDTRLRGFGFSSLFVGAMHLTGQPRYRDAVLRWINPRAGQFRSGDAIATLEAVDHRTCARQLAAWADQADLTRVTVDQFGYLARQRYLKFEVLGDEQAALDALEASLRNIRLLFDAYTLGEPQNDRIWPPDMVASVMALGDSPHARNQLYPRHYVSYEGFSDLAAWVRRKSDTALTIWLHNFAPGSESGILRVWRTPPGEYAVTFDGVTTRQTLHRAAGVPLTLLPGKTHELTVDLIKLDEADYWQRPDAAISPAYVAWTSPGTLTATVHNLGNSDLTDLRVALLDGQGNVVMEQTIARLAAPVDLVPRAVEVVFEQVPAGAVKIALDPDGAVAELYRLNNTAPIPSP